jgi:hypothetical protein
MDGDLARRIRWGNVGRAAAAAGVLVLVAGCPRLAPPAPRVASGEAVPVAVAQPARPASGDPDPDAAGGGAGRRERRPPAAPRGAAGFAAHPPRARTPRAARGGRPAPGGAATPGGRATPGETPAPAPPPPPAPASAPVPAPPVLDPAVLEFGPEG